MSKPRGNKCQRLIIQALTARARQLGLVVTVRFDQGGGHQVAHVHLGERWIGQVDIPGTPRSEGNAIRNAVARLNQIAKRID